MPVTKGFDQGVGGSGCVGSLECLDKEAPGWANGSALVGGTGGRTVEHC